MHLKGSLPRTSFNVLRDPLPISPSSRSQQAVSSLSFKHRGSDSSCKLGQYFRIACTSPGKTSRPIQADALHVVRVSVPIVDP